MGLQGMADDAQAFPSGWHGRAKAPGATATPAQGPSLPRLGEQGVELGAEVLSPAEAARFDEQ